MQLPGEDGLLLEDAEDDVRDEALSAAWSASEASVKPVCAGIDEQLMHGETPAVGPEFLHGANPAEALANKTSDSLVATHMARTHGSEWPVYDVGEHVTARVTPEMLRYMDQAPA